MNVKSVLKRNYQVLYISTLWCQRYKISFNTNYFTYALSSPGISFQISCYTFVCTRKVLCNPQLDAIDSFKARDLVYFLWNCETLIWHKYFGCLTKLPTKSVCWTKLNLVNLKVCKSKCWNCWQLKAEDLTISQNITLFSYKYLLFSGGHTR